MTCCYIFLADVQCFIENTHFLTSIHKAPYILILIRYMLYTMHLPIHPAVSLYILTVLHPRVGFVDLHALSPPARVSCQLPPVSRPSRLPPVIFPSSCPPLLSWGTHNDFRRSAIWHSFHLTSPSLSLESIRF